MHEIDVSPPGGESYTLEKIYAESAKPYLGTRQTFPKHTHVSSAGAQHEILVITKCSSISVKRYGFNFNVIFALKSAHS